MEGCSGALAPRGRRQPPIMSAPCTQPGAGFPWGGAVQACGEVNDRILKSRGQARRAWGAGGQPPREGWVSDAASRRRYRRAVTLPLGSICVHGGPSEQEMSCHLPCPPPWPFSLQGISGKVGKKEEEVGPGLENSSPPQTGNLWVLQQLEKDGLEKAGARWVRSAQAGSHRCSSLIQTH